MNNTVNAPALHPKTLSGLMLTAQKTMKELGGRGITIEAISGFDQIVIGTLSENGTDIVAPANLSAPDEVLVGYFEAIVSGITNPVITATNEMLLISTQEEDDIAIMFNPDTVGTTMICPQEKTIDLMALINDQITTKDVNRMADLPPPLAFVEAGDNSHALTHTGEIDIDLLEDDSDLLEFSKDLDESARCIIDIFDGQDDLRIATLSVEQLDYDTGQLYRSLRQSQVMSRRAT